MNTEKPSTRTVLIAGRGYLGSAVENQFQLAGWKTIAVTRSGREQSIACDLANEDAVKKLSTQLDEIDLIILCASAGGGGLESYQSAYLDAAKNLIACFANCRIIFTSSTSVYAQGDGQQVDETCPTEPSRETGQILVAAEKAILSAGGMVARLSGIYGPERNFSLRKFLAGDALMEPARTMNFIHRDDAAAAMLLLADMGEGGNAYNVSEAHSPTQLEFYTGLAEHFAKPLPPEGKTMSKRGWSHKRVSSKKLQALGWKPRNILSQLDDWTNQ